MLRTLICLLGLASASALAALPSALGAGKVAVITGASSGLGFEAALKCAELGMRVCLADVDGAMLAAAADRVRAASADDDHVLAMETDVGALDDVRRLREAVYERFGACDFLMNNAGTGVGAASATADLDGWATNLQTNLNGVLYGVAEFVPAMRAQATRCVVVNTGSKQGLTCPPGNLAYNVAKAGVKVLTEGLEHELRQEEVDAAAELAAAGGDADADGDGALAAALAAARARRVSAHLFVPGFVSTMLAYKYLRATQGAEFAPDAVPWSGASPLDEAEYEPKPASGAWTARETIDYLFGALAEERFYVVCPDNDVTSTMDRKRILWAAGDLVERDVPLSRWHPEYKGAFAAYMAEEEEGV